VHFCNGRKNSVQDHPTSRTCGIGTRKGFFGDRKFCFLQSLFATTQAAQFLGFLPKSSIKRLMLSTGLWQHTKMSTTLKAPNRLKDSKCEKGQLSSWPPIPYVPPMDLVITKEEPQRLKIKLPDGSIFNMSIYSHRILRNTLHTLLPSYASSSRRGST
jgi:hypothetical protein